MRELSLNESGATMVESGVILALFTVLCLILIENHGEEIFNAFLWIVRAR